MRFKRSDCGGGQVVSVFAFYSNDPSSNPAEAYSFSVKFSFEKNKNKQKESRVGPFLLKNHCTRKMINQNCRILRLPVLPRGHDVDVDRRIRREVIVVYS